MTLSAEGSTAASRVVADGGGLFRTDIMKTSDAADVSTRKRRRRQAAAWRAWVALEGGRPRLVLDGATGSELTQLPDVDWSSQWSGWPAHLRLPGAVLAVHRAYVDAGADMITTNTYCTNRHVMRDCLSAAPAGCHCNGSFVAVGPSPSTTNETTTVSTSGLREIGSTGDNDMGDLVARSNGLAVRLARQAAASAGRPVLVAGSMSNHPPQYAAATTNMEHTGPVNPTLLADWPSPEKELGNYREQAAALFEAGADVILLEMVKDRAHGDLLVAAASEVGLPVIVGLTPKIGGDGQVTARDDDGLTLGAMVKRWGCYDNVVGFSVMHVSADDAEAMVAALAAEWAGFIACYPNRQRRAHGLVGEDAADAYDDISSDEFAAMADKWYKAGARLVGGCCGVGPAHIRGIVAALAAAI